MSSALSRRKPAPAQIIVFHKKAKRAFSAVVPEAPTVIMEEIVTVTEAALETRTKRRKSHSSVPKVRVTPVVPTAEEQGDATSELMSLGHALFEKGKVREAKIVFEGLSLSMPNDAFVRTMLGTVSLALNELPKALEHFEAALDLDPSDIAARVYRGELRLHKRKLRPAIEDFEHAIAHGAANDPFVERAHRLLKMAKKPARR